MNIHGNISFFESLDKYMKASNGSEALKHVVASRDYVLQGFDQNQVAELLQIDGCDLEVSKELALAASTGLPISYLENEKPENYNDVKTNVEKTILSGNMEVVRGYIEKYAGRTYAKTIPRIIMARDNNTHSYINEIHSELRPLIEGKIIENNVLATRETRSALLNEREKLEFDLFGIWPVYLIQKQARKMKAEEALVDASGI